MPLDGLVLLVFSPLGLIVMVAAIVGSTLLLQAICPEAVSRFQLSRIFLGYAAALLSLLAYSLSVALQMAQRRNFADPDMVFSVLPGWTLSLFAIHVFVAILLLPTLGIPILLYANKRGWASLTTALLYAGLIAFAMNLIVEGDWTGLRRSRSPVESLAAFFGMFVPFAIVATAFSIVGRLPILPRGNKA